MSVRAAAPPPPTGGAQRRAPPKLGAAPSEAARARAVYHWITLNIEYDADASEGVERMRYSFLSLDRSSDPPQLVAGEYGVGDMIGKPGRQAVEQMSRTEGRKKVTLVWNGDDIARAFRREAEPRQDVQAFGARHLDAGALGHRGEQHVIALDERDRDESDGAGGCHVDLTIVRVPSTSTGSSGER